MKYAFQDEQALHLLLDLMSGGELQVCSWLDSLFPSSLVAFFTPPPRLCAHRRRPRLPPLLSRSCPAFLARLRAVYFVACRCTLLASTPLC